MNKCLTFFGLIVPLVVLVGCSSDAAQNGGSESDLGAQDGGTQDVDTQDGDTPGGDTLAEDAPSDAADVDVQDPIVDPDPPPLDTEPCEEPEYWPRSLESTAIPLTVHYRLANDRPMAIEVLELLEEAWAVEVDDLGFSPPLPDDGLCGNDDRFDVFLWHDIIESYVAGLEPNPATSHNDWFSYMVVDPWGPYGGELLDVTLVHELNHACQASDDWWESEWFFEASATYIEDVVHPEDDGWYEQLIDFQAHPDWSLTRYDDYETWFMYGAALYFHFVGEHYYDGAGDFVAAVWQGTRNPHGEDYDPVANEPDFEDALDSLLLADTGESYLDSVLTFARWRWHVGVHDDGAHFTDGASFTEVASATINVPTQVAINPAPMTLGSVYITLAGEPNAALNVSLLLPDDSPEIVVQAVPGLSPDSDGEVLDLSMGPAALALDDAGSRTLVLTVLPEADGDPDTRADTRYPITLIVE